MATVLGAQSISVMPAEMVENTTTVLDGNGRNITFTQFMQNIDWKRGNLVQKLQNFILSEPNGVLCAIQASNDSDPFVSPLAFMMKMVPKMPADPIADDPSCPSIN